MTKFGLESRFQRRYEDRVRRADKIVVTASVVILVMLLMGVL
jgi:hypothetical protein